MYRSAIIIVLAFRYRTTYIEREPDEPSDVVIEREPDG
jgi:hypothetical protein